MLTTVLIALQFLVAVVLIVVILLQRSAGEGLGAIGGSAQLFFDKGKGSDRFLERVTTIAAVLFMLLSLLIAVLG